MDSVMFVFGTIVAWSMIILGLSAVFVCIVVIGIGPSTRYAHSFMIAGIGSLVLAIGYWLDGGDVTTAISLTVLSACSTTGALLIYGGMIRDLMD